MLLNSFLIMVLALSAAGCKAQRPPHRLPTVGIGELEDAIQPGDMIVAKSKLF